jgi:hypothetical protein
MAWGLGLTVAVAGCLPALVPGPEGSLRKYERNAAEDRLGIEVVSGLAGGGGWTVLGVQGCMAVSVPWTVSIGAAGRNGAVGKYTQLLSSADVADAADAEIWIDVAKDGRVTWGQGMPEWATEAAPKCGPRGPKP